MDTRDLHSTLTQLWDYRWKKNHSEYYLRHDTDYMLYLFQKKQVQQLIHNDKTTMSSLYLLFVLFFLNVHLQATYVFTHHTHTHTHLYLDIPLTFPLPKRLFPVRWFQFGATSPLIFWKRSSHPVIIRTLTNGERWPWMGTKMIRIC